MAPALTRPRPRPDYGIHGYPYLLAFLGAAGLLAIAASLLASRGHAGWAWAAASAAALLFLPALLGLHYVWRGKFVHRDRVLDRVQWRGDERVLDVGTGGGLLMVGAARRAPRGRAVGIDVWSTTDLSGNTKARTLRNAGLEGVTAQIEVVDDDARSLSFPTASFDVVVSMLCLHNLERGREQALEEIARVLPF